MLVSSLDITNQTINRNGDSIQLSAKAFLVLIYLYKHPNQLITKQELLNEVWPGTITVEAVLKNVISEIRKALHDNPKTPQYIQTVHRRGYRFIGVNSLSVIDSSKIKSIRNTDNVIQISSESIFVGREVQLKALSDSWNMAHQGECLKVLIKGDPGVGKSTLVKSWLKTFSKNHPEVLIVQTRCIRSTKQIPYITLLDFLDQICNGRFAQQARELLAQYSPSLSAKLPNTATNAVMDNELPSPDKLFLQVCGFLDSFVKLTQFIWSIDDSHCCDKNTQDLINYHSLRNKLPNSMILMTQCDWQTPGVDRACAPMDIEQSDDQSTRLIHLPFLDRSEVNDLICRRMPNREIQPELVNQLFEISGGHPLFAKAMVDSIVQSKTIHNFPIQVQQRMHVELGKLNPRFYRLLQAASVIVVDEFSAAAIASLINVSTIEAEEYCEEIAMSTGWIQRCGNRMWPDGTVAQLYKFTHLVYRDFVYQTLPAAQKQAFHLQHAKRLEVAYQDKIDSIAKNLVYHFQQGWCDQGVKRYQHLVKKTPSTQLYRQCNLRPLYHKCRAPMLSHKKLPMLEKLSGPLEMLI